MDFSTTPPGDKTGVGGGGYAAPFVNSQDLFPRPSALPVFSLQICPLIKLNRREREPLNESIEIRKENKEMRKEIDDMRKMRKQTRQHLIKSNKLFTQCQEDRATRP